MGKENYTGLDYLNVREKIQINGKDYETRISEMEGNLSEVNDHIQAINTSLSTIDKNQWIYTKAGFNAYGYSLFPYSSRVVVNDFVYAGKGSTFATLDEDLWYMILVYDKTLGFVDYSFGASTTWGNETTAPYVLDDDYYLKFYFKKADGSEFTDEEVAEIPSAFSADIVIPSAANVMQEYDNKKMRSIFEEEMDSVVNSIVTNSAEQSMVLAVITDTHASPTALIGTVHEHIANVKELSKRIGLNGIFHLGDMTATQTKATSQSVILDYISKLRHADAPLFIARGNHDDDGTDTDFTLGEMYALLMRQGDTDARVVRNENDLYYYIDYDNYGVRVIVLDSNQTDTSTSGSSSASVGLSTAELSWFTNTALDTNYHVLVFSHIPPLASQMPSGYPSFANSGAVISALESWQTSEQRVIAWISGHTHADLIDTTSQAFPLITVACALNSVTSSLATGAVAPGPRTAGSLDQELWDCLVIKLESQVLELIRFGAGSDYTVSFAL